MIRAAADMPSGETLAGRGNVSPTTEIYMHINTNNIEPTIMPCDCITSRKTKCDCITAQCTGSHAV